MNILPSKQFNLTDIEGIGPKRAFLLKKMGIENAGDLLIHFPRDYIDRTRFNLISDCMKNNEELVVKITVTGFENLKTRSYKGTVLKVLINDKYVNASLICYNRNFLKNCLEINKEYIVCGKFEYKYNEFQSSDFEIIDETKDIFSYNRIVPVYPLTEGITMKLVRKIIFETLPLFTGKGKESLPQYLIDKRDFVSRDFALTNIHYPESFEALEKARERLKYYEFFELEFILALKKQKTLIIDKQKNYQKCENFNNVFNSLPFELTGDQKKAINEIKADLIAKSPMNRLLLGDVGSGKTIVALITALMVIENGYQVALMAPTEILAFQHYKNALNILSKFNIKIALITGSIKAGEKKILLSDLKEGKIDLLIGTHSLFQENISFKALSYIIIDEQQRFGVIERVKLMEKAQNPDILFMSATPIPRTLSLCLYGDLDITFIKEKPKMRKEIITKVIFEADLNDVFDHIKEEVQKGNKAYIVYPLVEESDKLDLKAASVEYEKIKNNYLKEISLSIIYGKMDSALKQKRINDFTAGEVSVLVSTTVIETGVDVSRATIMLVEHSERYGLSTLHQLRGRIGRGNAQSYCYFVSPKKTSDKTYKRLKILEQTDDGFLIADEDLKIRGAGEFLGARQSGKLPFRLASLYKDKNLFEMAREDAFSIINNDPKLEKEENLVLKNTLGVKFMDKYIDLLQG